MQTSNDDICRMNILVVDDDFDIGKMICTMLKKNYPTQKVHYAENAYTALKITEEVSPDISILDVLMPIVNGIELSFMLMKQNPNHSVVLMSVCKEYELVQRCYYTGAKLFLHKPIDLDKLFYNLDSMMVEIFYNRFYRHKRCRYHF
uniref:Response regulator receiver protein n=1 Tax=Geobacter sp. (strain M21) TaxID=443144 RepID=C6E833_GEOSM